MNIVRNRSIMLRDIVGNRLIKLESDASSCGAHLAKMQADHKGTRETEQLQGDWPIRIEYWVTRIHLLNDFCTACRARQIPFAICPMNQMLLAYTTSCLLLIFL